MSNDAGNTSLLELRKSPADAHASLRVFHDRIEVTEGGTVTAFSPGEISYVEVKVEHSGFVGALSGRGARASLTIAKRNRQRLLLTGLPSDKASEAKAVLQQLMADHRPVPAGTAPEAPVPGVPEASATAPPRQCQACSASSESAGAFCPNCGNAYASAPPTRPSGPTKKQRIVAMAVGVSLLPVVALALSMPLVQWWVFLIFCAFLVGSIIGKILR